MNRRNSLLGWVESHLNLVMIVSLLVIVIVPFVFSLPAFCRFFELHEGHNVGDAIGGITAPVIGIVSILLLCITLQAQKDAEYRTALENRIFQMINLHRKNVESMHSEARNLDGQDVFKMISDQIDNCVKDLTPFFEQESAESILSDSFAVELQKARPGVDLKAFAKLDIAYSVVYIGLRDEYLDTLELLLAKRYQKEFFMPLLNFLRLRPVSNHKEGREEWKKLAMESVETKKIFSAAIVDDDPDPRVKKQLLLYFPTLNSGLREKYYWGHQFRLGHYFRHLFSTVEYIDSQEDLSEKKKYEYVKMLRTQLSNTEQMVFMANSISDMGSPWELFRKDPDGKAFITTYNLIRNIPQKEVYGTMYREFYPDVDYEF